MKKENTPASMGHIATVVFRCKWVKAWHLFSILVYFSALHLLVRCLRIHNCGLLTLKIVFLSCPIIPFWFWIILWLQTGKHLVSVTVRLCCTGIPAVPVFLLPQGRIEALSMKLTLAEAFNVVKKEQYTSSCLLKPVLVFETLFKNWSQPYCPPLLPL